MVEDAPTLTIGQSRRQLTHSLVMGIANASPESLTDGDGSRLASQRLERCAELVEAGADVIDVGGQSARTDQAEVEVGAEIDRVLPVVEWMHATYPDVLVSVDTYRAPVARAVLAAGASIINDVSGLSDPELAQECARYGAALVVMHTLAPPKVRRQAADLYLDPVAEVNAFLAATMQRAIESGLSREHIVLDPGLDFTKTPHQTVAILRRIDEVRALNRPVLLAISRKDFIGAILQRPPRQRDIGTLAAVAHLARHPGYIYRVHDVAGTREVLRMLDVLTGREDLDPHYLLPDALRYG